MLPRTVFVLTLFMSVIMKSPRYYTPIIKLFMLLGIASSVSFPLVAEAQTFKGRIELQKDTLLDQNFGSDFLPKSIDVQLVVATVEGGLSVTIETDSGLVAKNLNLKDIGNGVFQESVSDFVVPGFEDCGTTASIVAIEPQGKTLSYRFTNATGCSRNGQSSFIRYSYEGDKLRQPSSGKKQKKKKKKSKKKGKKKKKKGKKKKR